MHDPAAVGLRSLISRLMIDDDVRRLRLTNLKEALLARLAIERKRLARERYDLLFDNAMRNLKACRTSCYNAIDVDPTIGNMKQSLISSNHELPPKSGCEYKC